MRDVILEENEVYFSLPANERLITFIVSWLFIYFLLVNLSSNYRNFIAVSMIVLFILMVIMVIIITIAWTSETSENAVFSCHMSAVINIKAWAKVFANIIEFVALGRAVNMNNGSFLPPASPAGILSVCCVMLLYCYHFFSVHCLYSSVTKIIGGLKVP